MGCDIHPAVEVRRKGIWRYHRPTTLCGYYAETWNATSASDYNKRIAADPKLSYLKPVAAGDRRNTWDRCKYHLPDYFSSRNYSVFSVLADVRNDGSIDPIQVDRGLPEDISLGARSKMSDEHSAGWVGLNELEAYNYHQTITQTGIVAEDDFRASLHGEAPDNYWESPSWLGHNAINVILEPDQYAGLFESPIDLLQGHEAKRGANYDTAKNYFVRCSWERRLNDYIDTIPNDWIPYLRRLIPKGGTSEDVRVVFDFDS